MASGQATAGRVGKLYRRDGNDTWHADYRDAKGRRRRESLFTADVKVARERLRDRELAGPADRTAHRSLEDALTHLLDTVHAGSPAGTVSCYRQKARHLIRLLPAKRPIDELTRDQALQYRAARIAEGASHGSIHKEMVVLRRALAESGVEGVVPKVSARYTPRTRHLTPAQLAAVLGHLNAKRRLWVVAGAYTGLRDSELVRLDGDDVDLEQGKIRVRGTKTAGAFRSVTISAGLRPMLEAALAEHESGPLLELWTNRRRDITIAYWKVIGVKVPNARKKESAAGLPRLSPNDLRRTFASWLKQAGVDSMAVSRMLGHGSTRMVELVYGQLNDEVYRAAIATLPPVPACDAGVSPGSARVARKRATGTDPKRPAPREGRTFAATSRGGRVPRDRVELPTRGFSVPGSPETKAPVLALLPGGKK